MGRDAAAGHAEMVMNCLDDRWQYSDTTMQAAASEGRLNVFDALKRGSSCTPSMREEVVTIAAGRDGDNG